MKSYDDAVNFHGHSCPGLALGYRVSLKALKEFKRRSEDEELVAVVENNSCAVDAVQVMTGCTFGKGNLIFKDYGKQVYTFISRLSGKSIRISIDWKRRDDKKEDKIMWNRYIKGDRSEKVIKYVHDRKAAKVRYILEADEKELLAVKRCREKLPPEAEIYTSIKCALCKERVMEPSARIKNGKIVCIPCSEQNSLIRRKK